MIRCTSKYRKFDKITQAPNKQSMVHYQCVLVNVIDQQFFTSAYLNSEYSFIDCIHNV